MPHKAVVLMPNKRGFNAMRAQRWTSGYPRVLLLLIVLAGGVVAAGCAEEEKKVVRPAGTMKNPEALLAAQARIMQGTIGSIAYVEGGIRLMQVRGYGLVTGLVDRGSSKCPESVRDHIVQSIRRYRLANIYRKTSANDPTPGEMIDSPDTAVVTVEAEIPAGSTKGRRFDVRVTAVDEDTRSLVGGVLISTELKAFRALAPGAVIEGKTLAKAAGPIFINPFRSATAPADAVNLREGTIIAGGIATENRHLGLVTAIESYGTVRQIQDAVNARFRADPPTATAENPRSVTLRVPPEYANREGRFIELLMRLPLSSAPAEVEARCKLLAAELTQPDAPHREIGLALEGMGRLAIEAVRPLYAHTNRPVNFYAACTGLRLGDEAALNVILRHAHDAKSPFRFQAIRELGQCGAGRRVAPALEEMLAKETDAEVRVLAYESLRLADPEAVASFVVGERPENYLLDIVPCEGKPFIYVRRTRSPRIALVGGDRLTCRTPLFCADPNGTATLTAKAGDRSISILKKDPAGLLGPYYVPLAVPVLTRFLGNDLRTDIDGQLHGLGLDYGSVVALLYRLCESRVIGCDLKWEEPTTADVLGPLTPLGRPESEL